ncbi:site-2 protease family protein [Sphingomonas sp. 3-13AW]|jgi:Zn-dependent protease|uniref:site-2 protease family protein n=1 Tax=Sphingomonas sp. 3-13AW TaxID=3050450 RepID=UPI003BB5174E
MDITQSVWMIAASVVTLVIAIVFHEVAHGVVANWLGDPTAAEQRRLTFNPIRHIDPIGTIGLPLLLAISGAPVFGWAKPVPVNAQRLRNPRWDMVLVALAGPGINILLALTGALLIAVLASVSGSGDGSVARFMVQVLLNFVLINLFLAVFNLLPVPPFDGGHVVEGLLPRPLAQRYAQIGRFGIVVLLVLLVVLPMISPQANVVGRIVTPIVYEVANAMLRLVGLGN